MLRNTPPLAVHCSKFGTTHKCVSKSCIMCFCQSASSRKSDQLAVRHTLSLLQHGFHVAKLFNWSSSSSMVCSSTRTGHLSISMCVCKCCTRDNSLVNLCPRCRRLLFLLIPSASGPAYIRPTLQHKHVFHFTFSRFSLKLSREWGREDEWVYDRLLICTCSSSSSSWKILQPSAPYWVQHTRLPTHAHAYIIKL